MVEGLFTRRYVAPKIRVGRDKSRVLKWALETGRKVLWRDDQGFWHAATDRNNTPHYAVETEDV